MARTGVGDPAWLALGLAIAAVCIAAYRTLKAGMLELTPEVLAGDVIVPRPSRAGDGVVEWVAVRLTIDREIPRSVLLSPVADVDMQHFIQATRRLDEDNAIEPFAAFALEAKRSLAKFVLFDVADQLPDHPAQRATRATTDPEFTVH